MRLLRWLLTLIRCCSLCHVSYIGNCELCMRWFLAYFSNMQVMHCRLHAHLLLCTRFIMTTVPCFKLCAIASYRLIHSHAQSYISYCHDKVNSTIHWSMMCWITRHGVWKVISWKRTTLREFGQLGRTFETINSLLPINLGDSHFSRFFSLFIQCEITRCLSLGVLKSSLWVWIWKYHFLMLGARLHLDGYGVFVFLYTIFQAFRTWNGLQNST